MLVRMGFRGLTLAKRDPAQPTPSSTGWFTMPTRSGSKEAFKERLEDSQGSKILMTTTRNAGATARKSALIAFDEMRSCPASKQSEVWIWAKSWTTVTTWK
jgi:hypothetical protein